MRLLIFIILLLFTHIAHAQLQWSNWNAYAGGGITFKHDTAETYFDVPANLRPPDFTGSRSYSYSSPANGNMIFLTDGVHIWNKDYRAIAPNDTLISCNDDYYKVQILPFAGDNSNFFLFHLYSPKGYVSAQQTNTPRGCPDRNLPGLYYSVLNMDIPNATGSLPIKNKLLLKDATDRIVMVKHANGRDNWIIAHPWESSVYVSFRVTDAGITDTVINEIGPNYPAAWQYIEGSMAASADGKRIAAGGYASLAEIYDFDNATGILSNYRTVVFPSESVSSVCFSPDDSKLYIATSDFKVCSDFMKLYQVDFNENAEAPSQTLFTVHKFDYSGSLKLTQARDNRIWIKGTKSFDNNGNYFDVLEHPNQPKNACMLHEDFYLSPGAIAFPGIINNYISQPDENAITRMQFMNADTIHVCFGTQTLTADAGYENYIWNTGATTQSITVTEPGLYTVLAGKQDFAVDYKKAQAYGFVYVKNTSPEVFIPDDTLYCPKQLHILVVPDNISQIKWSDRDTSRIKQVKKEGNYVMTGIDVSGCRVWDSVCVAIHDKPLVDFGPDSTLCTGETLLLNLRSYQDTTNPKDVKRSTYLWQDSSTSNTFKVTEPGIYRGEINFNDCVVADTINIVYKQLPAINFGADTSFCEGNSLVLSADFIPGAAYAWNTGSTDTSITVTSTGNYNLNAINEQCFASDTIYVEVKPLPVISLGNDTTLCAGDSILLIASDNDTYNYRWQNGDSTNTFPVKNGGEYHVQAGINNCFQSDTVIISPQVKPVIVLNDTTVCLNSKILLDPHVNTYDSVLWQNQFSQPTLVVSNAGQYHVKAMNSCGVDEKIITVKQQLCKIYMPNAFTPNHDGLNDVFRVKYPEIVRSIRMIIYNRWGQKIFETSDAYKGWDGTVNGIEQPAGTYVYQLVYSDVENNSEALKGYIVLIR